MAWVETERGVREQLRLYDTRGLHDGQELPRHYYSVADGFVLVYSVDSLESFRKVDTLKKEIDKSRDKKEVWLSLSAVQSERVIAASSQSRAEFLSASAAWSCDLVTMLRVSIIKQSNVVEAIKSHDLWNFFRLIT